MFRNLLIGSVTLAMVAVLAGASLADNQPKRKAPVPKTSQPAPKKASVRIETPKPAPPPKVVTVPIVRVPIKPTTQNPGRPPLQLPPSLTANGQPPANQPLGQSGLVPISSPTEVFVIG